MMQLRLSNSSSRTKTHVVRALALPAAAFLSLTTDSTLASDNKVAFVHDGKAGFVVSQMEYALGKDAEESGACPEGMTEGMRRDGGFPGYGGAGANSARTGQR